MGGLVDKEVQGRQGVVLDGPRVSCRPRAGVHVGKVTPNDQSSVDGLVGCDDHPEAVKVHEHEGESERRDGDVS